MTVVVADTSPLNYLILVGGIGILSQLCERMVVPEEVFAELMCTDAPQAVRECAALYPPGAAAMAPVAESETDVLLLIDESAGQPEASRVPIAMGTGNLPDDAVQAPSIWRCLLIFEHQATIRLDTQRLMDSAFRTPFEADQGDHLALSCQRRRYPKIVCRRSP